MPPGQSAKNTNSCIGVSCFRATILVPTLAISAEVNPAEIVTVDLVFPVFP